MTPPPTTFELHTDSIAFWVSILTGAMTAIMAGFTTMLAFQTKKLAKASRRSTKEAKKSTDAANRAVEQEIRSRIDASAPKVFIDTFRLDDWPLIVPDGIGAAAKGRQMQKWDPASNAHKRLALEGTITLRNEGDSTALVRALHLDGTGLMVVSVFTRAPGVVSGKMGVRVDETPRGLWFIFRPNFELNMRVSWQRSTADWHREPVDQLPEAHLVVQVADASGQVCDETECSIGGHVLLESPDGQFQLAPKDTSMSPAKPRPSGRTTIGQMKRNYQPTWSGKAPRETFH